MSLEELMKDNGSSWDELNNMEFDCKNDLIMMPYSSGTTGKPKGVPHTHYEAMCNYIQTRWGFDNMNAEVNN